MVLMIIKSENCSYTGDPPILKWIEGYWRILKEKRGNDAMQWMSTGIARYDNGKGLKSSCSVVDGRLLQSVAVTS